VCVKNVAVTLGQSGAWTYAHAEKEALKLFPAQREFREVFLKWFRKGQETAR
jgi:hypothetical protein